MIEKGFLTFCGLFWITYGFFCTFWPNTVAGFIGYEFSSADAIIEVIAMYGGLEFGLGCMFMVCALNPQYIKLGLLLVVATIGALAVTRTIAFIVLGGDVTIYTYGGIIYEGLSGVIALALYIRSSHNEKTQIKNQDETEVKAKESN